MAKKKTRRGLSRLPVGVVSPAPRRQDPFDPQPALNGRGQTTSAAEALAAAAPSAGTSGADGTARRNSTPDAPVEQLAGPGDVCGPSVASVTCIPFPPSPMLIATTPSVLESGSAAPPALAAEAGGAVSELTDACTPLVLRACEVMQEVCCGSAVSTP